MIVKKTGIIGSKLNLQKTVAVSATPVNTKKALVNLWIHFMRSQTVSSRRNKVRVSESMVYP